MFPASKSAALPTTSSHLYLTVPAQQDESQGPRPPASSHNRAFLPQKVYVGDKARVCTCVHVGDMYMCIKIEYLVVYVCIENNVSLIIYAVCMYL